MNMYRKSRIAWLTGLALSGCLATSMAAATDTSMGPTTSNKLLLTGGVSQVEG